MVMIYVSYSQILQKNITYVCVQISECANDKMGYDYKQYVNLGKGHMSVNVPYFYAFSLFAIVSLFSLTLFFPVLLRYK